MNSASFHSHTPSLPFSPTLHPPPTSQQMEGWGVDLSARREDRGGGGEGGGGGGGGGSDLAVRRAGQRFTLAVVKALCRARHNGADEALDIAERVLFKPSAEQDTRSASSDDNNTPRVGSNASGEAKGVDDGVRAAAGQDWKKRRESQEQLEEDESGEMELSNPLASRDEEEEEERKGGGEEEEEEELVLHAQARVALAAGFLRNGSLRNAKLQVQALGACGAAVENGAFNGLLKLFGKRNSLRGALMVVEAMRSAGAEPDPETLEFLANAAVRSVDFVTGAVSMETLPPPLPEACFAGRSNVGKSSLVNMLTNRKKLAFASKTPGKTQQFNYFIVNQHAPPPQRFYLVDLPGVGYAEVPKHLRASWLHFYEQYLRHRHTLQVFFQLVDGRHGVMADDEALMRMLADADRGLGEESEASGATRRKIVHVIVLTKMDKVDHKVSRRVLDGVQRALAETGCDPATPIVQTSAVSKRGREQLWGFLRLAAAHPDDADLEQDVEEGPDSDPAQQTATDRVGGQRRGMKGRAAKKRGGGKRGDQGAQARKGESSPGKRDSKKSGPAGNSKGGGKRGEPFKGLAGKVL